MTNQVIPDEAVEAAAKAVCRADDECSADDYYTRLATAALEAAYPIMLSHERDSDPTPYKLPEPVVLPDLADEAVAREYRKRAEKCARETRRTRRHYWLHQLFPWL